MQLSKNALGQIAAQPRLEIPSAKLLGLPEKVLQFGTGVLLRGLPDYFIAVSYTHLTLPTSDLV